MQPIQLFDNAFLYAVALVEKTAKGGGVIGNALFELFGRDILVLDTDVEILPCREGIIMFLYLLGADQHGKTVLSDAVVEAGNYLLYVLVGEQGALVAVYFLFLAEAGCVHQHDIGIGGGGFVDE